LAETFRMVSAACQRGALRIPDAAFLISIHHAGRNVRRSPSRGRSRAELRPPPRNNTGGVFAAGCPWGLGSPSFAPLGFFVWARATYRSKVAPRHPVGALVPGIKVE
jgi:hypothetical protein